ncbi:MAG: flagellar assembly peptidoglycan hydrolase FlgJ [Methylophaga sp.]|nr:MAG: flagellar assembly peptidoglycan hydrolase FlgJ [Methylophaga sp.]
MAVNTHISQTAIDFQGLAELRRASNKDGNDAETMRQVAGQFESLFINMMLKSMRQASLGDGLFDSSQSDMYRDIADQQMAMDLSARGGLGLQEVILRQLTGNKENKDINSELGSRSYSVDTIKTRSKLEVVETTVAEKQAMVTKSKAVETVATQMDLIFDSPESFIQKLWPMAKQAAEKLGVAPEVILSQAALETGWGKHVIKDVNGQSSHNLFNIKADSRWQGDFVTKGTLEYRDGVAAKEQAKFRSYDSYQQSFNDYVNFLQTQPRYQDALKQTANPDKFIEGLHKAGYATDPTYSDKIKRIMRSDTLAQLSQSSGYS